MAPILNRSGPLVAASLFLLLAGALLPPFAGSGQEAVRMSLASAEAAEARRKAQADPGDYNLRLGPTAWRFAAGLGFEFSDNIRLEPAEHAKSDLLFRPEVDARMLWPMSEKNSLSLALGAGYQAYVQNPGYNRFYIQPGTELSFDLYVGKLWLNFHDRLAIVGNNYQDPTVVGEADYSRLENTAGVTGLLDLNKLQVRLGYDHIDYVTLSGNAAYQDGRSDNVFASLGYLLQPEMTAGIETGAGVFRYDSSDATLAFTEALQWNAGAFFEAQLTEYIRARASLGGTVLSPRDGPSEGDDFSGIYGQASLTHRLNRQIEYNIAGGRSVSFALYGGTVDIYWARLSANWYAFNQISLTTAFTFENGSFLYGEQEEFNRYGPSLYIGRRLTEKLRGSLGYQFYLRDSDLPSRDYTVNIVSLDLRYQF